MNVINDIVNDYLRDRLARDIINSTPREELKERLRQHMGFPITVSSAPKKEETGYNTYIERQQTRNEEFIKRQEEERTGIKENDYPFYLKKHPNQRII